MDSNGLELVWLPIPLTSKRTTTRATTPTMTKCFSSQAWPFGRQPSQKRSETHFFSWNQQRNNVENRPLDTPERTKWFFLVWKPRRSLLIITTQSSKTCTTTQSHSIDNTSNTATPRATEPTMMRFLLIHSWPLSRHPAM